ncbi:MAG: hypothetical protein EAZ18_13075 [Oscillatoriales cyanobacterium]|nr:MAG: hypothetical protein EAZ18_13075 [Oscillatoriales cyanobacterium]
MAKANSDLKVLNSKSDERPDMPVPGFPELLRHGKCDGDGCDECDFGWSRTTDWEEASKAYMKGFDPNDLPAWMAVTEVASITRKSDDFAKATCREI